MKYHIAFAGFILFALTLELKAQDYDVVSPDGRLRISIHVHNGTTYELWKNQTQLITPSSIALNLEGGTVIGKGTVDNIERNEARDEIEVSIGKNKKLKDAYNELIIHYREGYSLLVRAYDEGVAYRFVTRWGEGMTILSEDAVFNFANKAKVYFPDAGEDMRNYGFFYTVYSSIKEIPTGKFSVAPILFEFQEHPYKVVVAESDVFDYPGLYMERNGDNSMRGMWAKYPVTNDVPDDPYSDDKAVGRLSYIAKTTGNRTFPWRVIVVSEEDKDLLNNELVYLLAEPCRLKDTSWIKPGKTCWEWWHKAMLEGVNFPVGFDNLGFDLYRYYVDFAAANGIEYMTLDAGWSENYIFRLCNYAKSKNVKIIVWIWASYVRKVPGWLQKLKNYGVAGVKIDFFDRNDQEAMNWCPLFAEMLAEQKMVGIFHGCPIPTGLNRTYPNLLNFEAVNGNECNFWVRVCTPDYHVQFPFIRLLAGPTDFTPGSMRNKSRYAFAPVDLPNTVPSSMGTRAHELSMYVIYDQWLGFLCDAPTEYAKYPDILDFLSSVPTVWDKTIPLDSKLGEYISIAKQTGDDWYVGGMTGWKTKDLEVDFSFLPSDMAYDATILRDSSSSGSYPTRYVCENIVVAKDTKRTLKMASGGGFVIRLKAIEHTGTETIGYEGGLSVSFDSNIRSLHIASGKPVLSVEVYAASGTRILSRSSRDRQRLQQIKLPVLPKGVYIVKAVTAAGTRTARFLY